MRLSKDGLFFTNHEETQDEIILYSSSNLNPNYSLKNRHEG